jgi:hypothetical protein
MKKQFLHEHHNRMDKAKKEEYQHSLQEKAATPQSWSGLNNDKIKRQQEVRELEIRKARTKFFVYGKWLFQHTNKLSHFTFLNAKNGPMSDAELCEGFNFCKEAFAKDFALICAAIKKAPVVRPTGLPKWFPETLVVIWEMPNNLIANKVSQKVPPDFYHTFRETDPTHKGKGGT